MTQTNIEKEIDERYKKKWAIPKLNDVQLKEIAKNIYNNLIFTDRHCNSDNLFMVFMTLSFLKPGKSKGDNTTEIRDNIIYELLEQEIDEKYYYEHINNVGMIYECYTKAGPTSINGMPCFFSHHVVNKEDTVKVWEYYEQYKLIRETVDNL